MAEEKDDAKKTGEGTKDDATDHKAEAEKWKALARKHEDRAKESKAELDKLKADSDATKSDQEKILERLEAAEKRAAEAEANGLRFQVAASKKLTPAQAKRLQGSTLEELEADADELIEAFKITPDTGTEKDGDGGKDAPAPKSDGGKPKEKLRPGADTGADTEDQEDVREIVEKIPRARF